MSAQPKPKKTPFNPSWPDPDPRFLRADLPPAPPLPLGDVLGPRLAAWVRDAAEAKGAPPDYVLAALLAVAGSTIGNARWVAPWRGWAEPPVLWAMCIGLPSAGHAMTPCTLATVRPGPVLHVWRDGQEVVALPLDLHGTLALMEALLR